MRSFSAFFASLVLTLGSTVAAESATIHIPLVANTAPIQDPTHPTRWFTEVRIWNRNAVAVTARISDVIGSGNPSRSEFAVPAGGVLDLNGYDFFDATTPNSARIISALVELTSPLPLDVWTTINVDLRNAEGCVGSLGPPPPFTCREPAVPRAARSCGVSGIISPRTFRWPSDG